MRTPRRRLWSRDRPTRVNIAGLVNLSVSASARRFIEERGHRLFIWTEDFGGGFAVLKASTQAPPGGRDFSEHDFGDFVAAFSLGDVGGDVSIDLRRWPRRGLVARSSMAPSFGNGGAAGG